LDNAPQRAEEIEANSGSIAVKVLMPTLRYFTSNSPAIIVQAASRFPCLLVV